MTEKDILNRGGVGLFRTTEVMRDSRMAEGEGTGGDYMMCVLF